MTILPTQNEGYGFYGTAKDIVGCKGIEKLWNEAFTIIKKKTRLRDEMVREVLDSRWGRHMVDDLYDEILKDNFTEKFNSKYTKKDIIELAKEIEKELQE